jgi:anti-anti-sigma regulatory factor
MLAGERHKMRLVQTTSIALTFLITLAANGQENVPVEPLFRELPPGIFVDSSVEVPAAQRKSIGQKLGGSLERLTNSIVRVHGRSIQVNVIAAVDDTNGQAVYASLAKMKSPPFLEQKGPLIIEYVGSEIDAALAVKTSYELGILKKPTSVKYRVVVDLAAVETMDYMACNPLFNQFIALQRGTNQQAVEQIQTLSKNFTFGRNLVLRNPSLGGGNSNYTFLPAASDLNEGQPTTSYTFAKLPMRQGVPFVTVTMDLTVDSTGFHAAVPEPPNSLTAATPFWPSDDPEIVALAQQITLGKADNSAKAMAILEWLSPGKNIKYSGQTGSRWGTAKVLEQKFGHCWDFSDCFVTLARAAGVPSRQVAGWFYGSSGHVWAEFYVEGKGWQQVDPTGGGNLLCGIYHIPYFTSETGPMPLLYVAMPKIEVLETK